MYENSVLRNILGPKRVEVTGDVRRLHCEDFHYLYYQPDIIWGNKIQEGERGASCCACGEEKKCGYGSGKENLKERHHLEDLCVDGRMVL